MSNKISSILVTLLLFTAQSFSQISNVKLDHDIYEFLSHLSQKGIIKYDDLIKPLSRRYIAKKLVDAENNLNNLTPLQKDELKFYKAEFGYEVERIKSQKGKVKNEKEEFSVRNQASRIKHPESSIKNQVSSSKELEDSSKTKGEDKKPRDLFDKSWEFEVRKSGGVEENIKLKPNVDNSKFKIQNSKLETEREEEKVYFIKKDKYKRWRFFNYRNNIMNLSVNPVLGYEIANWETQNYRNLFAGISFAGEIGNIIGFNFDLKTTLLKPGFLINEELFNSFSPKTSINAQLINRERIEHSTVNVDLGTDWQWGSFTIGKNHLNWGYAQNGKIVLSRKAPSMPYVRLNIKPADWFSFNYIHAWLNSDVIDTNSFYPTWRVRDYEKTDRNSLIQKFLVMHSITFSFWNGIDFSMGESVIYADDLQLAYFIPIMFFDLADEYLSKNNYSGSSTQLFLALSSKNHIPNTHLYSSFHADELTPEGLFDPATQYYKMAFTFGGSVVDLPVTNLSLTLEYTKVYPGNYRHFIPTLTYESSSALLGHWIGDNGDLFFASIDYTIFRGLKVKLWTQHIRKGTEALGNIAYTQQGFLFTDNIRDRKNYSYYGFDIDYEYTHDLTAKFHYQYIDYERQFEKDKFGSTLYRDISFTMGYGL